VLETKAQNRFFQDFDPLLSARLENNGKLLEVRLSQAQVSECIVVTSTDAGIQITGNSSHLAAMDAARALYGGEIDQVGSGMLVPRASDIRLRLDELSLLVPPTELRLILQQVFQDRVVTVTGC
jgi:hypothetical protein